MTRRLTSISPNGGFLNSAASPADVYRIPVGEHEDLWGELEQSMSSPLNFDGVGGCEEGKTGSKENYRRDGRLGG